MPKLTICGGGNAAHVLIALAAQAGWEVDVFASLADEAERLQAGTAAGGGMQAKSEVGVIVGSPRRISSNPAEVIPGSELILLAAPAFGHGPILQAIAQSLEPGATIGALPARGGFDTQAFSILKGSKVPGRLFGLQTLPWACRIVRYGQEVEILGTKAAVDLAAAPAGAAPELAGQLTPVLGVKLRPVASFLTLTLANTGQLIHPGIMYGLGRDREGVTFSQADIPLFYQGLDEATAQVLEAMSQEVQVMAHQLASRLPDFAPQEVLSIHDWLGRAYSGAIRDGSSLRRAFMTNRAYAGLKFPSRPIGPDAFAIDYKARYLSEDVPFGLVVTRGIAELIGVETPVIDEVITWAQAHLERQYLVKGALTGADLAETRAPQVYGIKTIADVG